MAILSSHPPGPALLILSALLLGLWLNTLKAAGSRWRFELYYLDFILGALAASLLAAFTLGTFASELPFGDRLLIAGKTSQVVTLSAGFVFNLGNMLFLAAVPILGMAGAVLLWGSVALLVVAGIGFVSGTYLLNLIASACLLLAFALSLKACRSRAQRLTPPPPKPARPLRKPSIYIPLVTRALIVTVIGGIVAACSLPLAARGIEGEFGVGPFGGGLLFAIGALVSTAFFSMYFMNISVSGPPVTLRAYAKGGTRQHLLGWLGGIIWLAGMLTLFMAEGMAPQSGVKPDLGFGIPAASLLVVALTGLLVWREFKHAPGRAKQLTVTALVLLAAAITALSAARGR